MTKVISLRKRKLHNFDIPKKSFKRKKISSSEIIKVIFLILSIISIFSGCIFFKLYEIEYITEICNNFILNLQKGTYFEVISIIFKFDAVFYLSVFFLGTSFVGIPLTAIPLIIKCIFIGYLNSYMYCEFGLKGILFLLVLIYPMIIITTTSQIYSANESIYMSKYLINTVTNKNTADDISVRLYIIRNFVLIGISLIAISVNSFLIVTIGSRFNLQ